MIPETSANMTIELYRAEPFPDVWALHRVLLSGIRAADATLYDDGTRLWLFACVARPERPNFDTLYLFTAKHLTDEWLPHPANPIIADARYARPAGRLFVSHGQLYRPAQDCSREYGTRIVLCRVDEMDSEAYSETPVDAIDASIIGAKRTHCHSSDAEAAALDGMRYRRRTLL
jgi:hypothetical protein